MTTMKDACIVINSLQPGAYYVEVSDTGGGSGDALVSVTQIFN